MCGIAAVIGKPDRIGVRKMLRLIKSRGESFNEHKIFPQAALGTNRLKIVDRKHAQQPVTSEDGRFAIIFNGELYNYKAIQKELQAEGVNFKTDSDTEVILQAYVTWGSDCLEKFNGMYAFVVYDQEFHKFFVARDPLGIKPLFYAKDADGTYLFASEIKSLVPLKNVEEVCLFPPGFFMEDGKLKQYYELLNSPILEENKAIDELRVAFDEAVRVRVDTDLPVAVFLSGGIDSTAVLATARKFHHAVTAIVMGNKASTDREMAIRYCEENDIPYIVEETPSEKHLARLIPKIVKITESFEPNMIRQSVLSYLISKAARRHGFKIALVGEGADELFAGYPEFTTMDTQSIESAVLRFTKNLHRTQLQRVDRTSMAHTLEVRVPFLDKKVIDVALRVPVSLKIKKEKSSVTTKYILRKAMEDRLPAYIYNRAKVVLSEGAGYKGNQKVGGLFYDLIEKKVSDKEVQLIQQKYSSWNLETKEEIYYFKLFRSYKYEKAHFNQERTVVNKTNSVTEHQILARKILNQFDTWSFKREQPHTREKLLETVLDRVTKSEPVSFVMYWGKGQRSRVGAPEEEAIEFLEKMFNRIRSVYDIGIEFTAVVTDTHATLNGHTATEIKDYFNSVETLLNKYNAKAILMSKVANVDLLNLESFMSDMDVPIPSEIFEMASRHYKGSPEEGARKYVQLNQHEKKQIGSAFSNSIFLTNNGSSLNILFPKNLPIFYMYSIRKGNSQKPWFIEL